MPLVLITGAPMVGAPRCTGHYALQLLQIANERHVYAVPIYL